jgi:hypothetical protein
MKRRLHRPLHLADILRWASAYRERIGKWPTRASGSIPGTGGETWTGVDNALRNGLRTLPGGSSLAQLLTERCGARHLHCLTPLTETKIVEWVDAHYQRTATWPNNDSGLIPGSGGEKWMGIENALRKGLRGLPGGSSLAKLLAEHRGVRNRKQLPPLTEEQILAWADAHQRRTGSWPTGRSGPIAGTPGETWTAVQMALRNGLRGLPGGSSLPLLLAEHRGARNAWSLPGLTIEQILTWADAFHERTGRWPHPNSGTIPEAPEESWTAINHALKRGSRGLPAGRSLAELLAIERGVRNRVSLPRLSRQRILAWADAHHQRTGKWPTADSGPIPECPGETWLTVREALRKGRRGLRGRSSLAQFLERHRARRNIQALPPLSHKKILAWADAHQERTGKWPNVNSGAVQDAPGERWASIDDALRQGHRGLSGGTSLLRLLVKKRGVRNPLNLPPLTLEQILHWADLHFHRTGRWPKYNIGPIVDAAEETWAAVDGALRYGKRGLSGRSSLAKLLAEKRGEQAPRRGEVDPSSGADRGDGVPT